MIKTEEITNASAHVTAEDERELQRMIERAKSERNSREDFSALESALRRAIVIESWLMPRNVITMHSRVGLVDLDTYERLVFTLVYPAEANMEDGKISAFDPLGAAMLGYRTGDEIEWKSPTGLRRFVVEKVIYQPEARRRHNSRMSVFGG